VNQAGAFLDPKHIASFARVGSSFLAPANEEKRVLSSRTT